MSDTDRPSRVWLFLANLSLCLCSVREDDSERQALYPPDTVLSAPRPRLRPRLSNLSPYGSTTSRRWPSASTSPIKSGGLAGFTGIESNVDAETRREEGKRKMDSISKAFAERMTALDLPPHIHTLNMPFTPSLQPLTTAVSHPTLPTIHTIRPLGSPNRPSAPHLGRSISEPRSLHDLGGFAAHHVPFGSSVVVHGRGISPGVSRGRGRMRSATIGERWTVPGEGTRGRKGLERRSPSGLNKESIDSDEVEQEAKMERSASPSLNLSFGRPVLRSCSNSQSHSCTRRRQSSPLAGHPDQQEPLSMGSCWIDPESHLHSSSRAHSDVRAQEVIHRDLGLNALYSGSAASHPKRIKGKGKGKKTRRMRLSSS